MAGEVVKMCQSLFSMFPSTWYPAVATPHKKLAGKLELASRWMISSAYFSAPRALGWPMEARLQISTSVRSAGACSQAVRRLPAIRLSCGERSRLVPNIQESEASAAFCFSNSGTARKTRAAASPASLIKAVLASSIAVCNLISDCSAKSRQLAAIRLLIASLNTTTPNPSRRLPILRPNPIRKASSRSRSLSSEIIG